MGFLLESCGSRLRQARSSEELSYVGSRYKILNAVILL